MRTRFDVFVSISSENITRLFLLKKVKPSHDPKMIKLITFDFLLATWNDQVLSWLENGNSKVITRLSQSRSLGFLVWCGRTGHEQAFASFRKLSLDRASRSQSRYALTVALRAQKLDLWASLGDNHLSLNSDAVPSIQLQPKFPTSK